MDKYEEALERAREIYNAPVATIVIRTFLEQIFPELIESEDERIRKVLVDMVKRETGFTGFPSQGQVLAYLEKQKKQSFTHHEIDESLRDAVTHQMEDDGDVDDFVRRGIDNIVLKYAELGAQWQKEQTPVARENDFVSKPQTSVEILRHYLVWAGNSESEEDCPYTWRALADAIRDGIKALEEQQPAKWSEEDETCLEYALWCVTKTRCCVAKDACDLDACRCAERWLKALRDRFALSHWKPSEKQMQYLLAVINDPNNAGAESCHLTLESLYNDLKNL